VVTREGEQPEIRGRGWFLVAKTFSLTNLAAILDSDTGWIQA
jgi:hypothetical protein